MPRLAKVFAVTSIALFTGIACGGKLEPLGLDTSSPAASESQDGPRPSGRRPRPAKKGEPSSAPGRGPSHEEESSNDGEDERAPGASSEEESSPSDAGSAVSVPPSTSASDAGPSVIADAGSGTKTGSIVDAGSTGDGASALDAGSSRDGGVDATGDAGTKVCGSVVTYRPTVNRGCTACEAPGYPVIQVGETWKTFPTWTTDTHHWGCTPFGYVFAGSTSADGGSGSEKVIATEDGGKICLSDSPQGGCTACRLDGVDHAVGDTWFFHTKLTSPDYYIVCTEFGAAEYACSGPGCY